MDDGRWTIGIRGWCLDTRVGMDGKLRLMRVLVGLGGAMLVAAPSSALAHDNLGGDELAASNWMLIGAMAVILMGLLAGLWAWRNGQFNNVEESKYRMIDLSDDYDKVMAEADERAREAHAAEDAAQKHNEMQSPAAATGTGKLPSDRAVEAKP